MYEVMNFLRLCVNLLKIKSAVTLEQVRDFRIKEQTICAIFIHFVAFLSISYTSISKAGNNLNFKTYRK
jgi:hypothetical protein